VLYRQGGLKLRELITRTYRLEEINLGYADLEAGKNLRGIVRFDTCATAGSCPQTDLTD